MKRRGLLAGVTALVGTLMTKLGTAERAEATHAAGGTANADSNAIHAGAQNPAASSTRISANVDNGTLVVFNNYNAGIVRRNAILGRTSYAIDNAAGVAGTNEATDGGIGVSGATNAATGMGVYGFVGNSSFFEAPVQGVGVHGRGSSNGVRGDSAAGFGVQANSTNNAGLFAQSETNAAIVANSNSNSSPAIYGNSGTGNQFGVSGRSISSVGTYGRSDSNIGMFGESATGLGVKGYSQGSNGVEARSGGGGAGLAAFSQSGIGVYATSARGPAARFDGTVVINGNLTLNGSKAAHVKLPNGELRELYAVEMPESYFEDTGRGQLKGGRVVIPLDKDFAQVVKADDYDVFLTPYGPSKGLFVSRLTPSEFEVQEQDGGTGSISFSYRVLAKRKDLAGKRMAKVELGPVPSPSPDVKRPPELKDLIPDLQRVQDELREVRIVEVREERR